MSKSKDPPAKSQKPKVPDQQRIDNAQRLKALYYKKFGKKSTQDEIGKQALIGTQGMVNQYLNATRPLNIKAAIKFCKILDCKIDDFSPEIANQIEEAAQYVLKSMEWPFESVTRDIFDKLSPSDKAAVNNSMLIRAEDAGLLPKGGLESKSNKIKTAA